MYGHSDSGHAGYFEGNVYASGKVGIGATLPNSRLQVAGSLATAFQSIVLNGTPADYTMTVNDSVVVVTASGADRTVYLPDAALITGRQYTIKRANADGPPDYRVIVDGDGGDLIDGAASYALDNQYDAITVVSDGTNWWIIWDYKGLVPPD